MAAMCTVLYRACTANKIAATDRSNTCHNIKGILQMLYIIYHSTYSKKANAATTGAMPMLIIPLAVVVVRLAVVIVRKAVDRIMPLAVVIVRLAVVIVRKAVDRTKFAAIKHPRPGTKYRQTRHKVQANKYSHNRNKG